MINRRFFVDERDGGVGVPDTANRVLQKVPLVCIHRCVRGQLLVDSKVHVNRYDRQASDQNALIEPVEQLCHATHASDTFALDSVDWNQCQ